MAVNSRARSIIPMTADWSRRLMPSIRGTSRTRSSTLTKIITARLWASATTLNSTSSKNSRSPCTRRAVSLPTTPPKFQISPKAITASKISWVSRGVTKITTIKSLPVNPCRLIFTEVNRTSSIRRFILIRWGWLLLEVRQFFIRMLSLPWSGLAPLHTSITRLLDLKEEILKKRPIKETPRRTFSTRNNHSFPIAIWTQHIWSRLLTLGRRWTW